MSHLAWVVALLAPDSSRWQPMLAGLAAFTAAAAAAVLLRPPPALALLLVLLGLCAWLVGAFAMVGYVRWFVAAELRRAAEDRDRKE